MSDIVIVKKLKTRPEWRKLVKKLRRKKIRQKLAKERDEKIEKEEAEKLKNPIYLTWLAEQRALELMREEEEERQRNEDYQKWIIAETESHRKYVAAQQKKAELELKRAKERIQLLLEMEREEKLSKEREIKEKRRLEEERERHASLMARLEAYMIGGEIPEELTQTADTNPSRPLCSFFEKTSSCRFGDRCARNHSRPGISKIILIPNFFTHIRLEHGKTTEYGSDLYLEYDDDDMQTDYREFFQDVCTEFEKFGRIEHFFCCNNYEPHLRGNVFVEYCDQRDALKAFRSMQGRYYGGRQLNIEFSSLASWMAAICGLSFSRKCAKGKGCNYIHLFRNPQNKYGFLNRKKDDHLQTTRQLVSTRRDAGQTNKLNWDDDDEDDSASKRHLRWSESPEHSPTRSEARNRRERSRSGSHKSSRDSSKQSKNHHSRRRSREKSYDKHKKRRKSKK